MLYTDSKRQRVTSQKQYHQINLHILSVYEQYPFVICRKVWCSLSTK
jgi:hypothetical protein